MLVLKGIDLALTIIQLIWLIECTDPGKDVSLGSEIITPQSNRSACQERPCGQNAECLYGGKQHYCRCRCGYYGDPSKICELITQKDALRAEIELSCKVNISGNITSDAMYYEF